MGAPDDRWGMRPEHALTAAVLGGLGGMSNGATFEISFFYRDASSNAVTIVPL